LSEESCLIHASFCAFSKKNFERHSFVRKNSDRKKEKRMSNTLYHFVIPEHLNVHESPVTGPLFDRRWHSFLMYEGWANQPMRDVLLSAAINVMQKAGVNGDRHDERVVHLPRKHYSNPIMNCSLHFQSEIFRSPYVVRWAPTDNSCTRYIAYICSEINAHECNTSLWTSPLWLNWKLHRFGSLREKPSYPGMPLRSFGIKDDEEGREVLFAMCPCVCEAHENAELDAFLNEENAELDAFLNEEFPRRGEKPGVKPQTIFEATNSIHPQDAKIDTHELSGKLFPFGSYGQRVLERVFHGASRVVKKKAMDGADDDSAPPRVELYKTSPSKSTSDALRRVLWGFEVIMSAASRQEDLLIEHSKYPDDWSKPLSGVPVRCNRLAHVPRAKEDEYEYSVSLLTHGTAVAQLLSLMFSPVDGDRYRHTEQDAKLQEKWQARSSIVGILARYNDDLHAIVAIGAYAQGAMFIGGLTRNGTLSVVDRKLFFIESRFSWSGAKSRWFFKGDGEEDAEDGDDDQEVEGEVESDTEKTTEKGSDSDGDSVMTEPDLLE
jgi:hypothetical protein